MITYFLFLIGKAFTLVAGGYNIKKLSVPYKIMLILVAFATVIECYGLYISTVLHNQNAWLFNIYMIIEVWLMGLSAIYLIYNKYLKIFWFLLLSSTSTYWIIDIYSHSIFQFATSSLILNCIILTFMYIVVLFSNSLFSTKNIFSQPVFWLCFSTILFFGCDIPFMGLHNYLFDKNPKLGDQLVNINNIHT